jgi:spore coat protein A
MANSRTTPAQLYPSGLFVDELAFPPVVTVGGRPRKVVLRAKSIRVHSVLPKTSIWGYTVRQAGRELINPTLQSRSGQSVTIDFKNGIRPGSLPIGIAQVEYLASDGNALPENAPGSVAATPGRQVRIGAPAPNGSQVAAADLPAAFSTHLHGAVTEANSDGWPENLMMPGQSHRFTYSMNEQSALLWYHDHALHTTRFNVYSGLAAFWTIRDLDDDRVVSALGLQGQGIDRPEFELPLLIQDCNFELNAQGAFTGQLLHKTEFVDGVPEFFGPYTLVNRTLWPKCTVARRQYRLRLLNGSNARTLRLALADDSGKQLLWSTIAQQIGGDGGLRATPIPAENELVLAPAERLDLIVDFSLTGSSFLTLLNTAPAPFGGEPNVAPIPVVGGPPAAQALTDRLPMPEVMRFVLSGQPAAPRAIPALSSRFRRIVHDAADADPGEPVVVIPDVPNVPGGHHHRLVALTEERPNPADMSTTLMLRELMPYDPASTLPIDAKLLQISEPDPTNPANPPKTTLYRTAARMFHDGPTIFGALGEIDVWRIINLTGDTHPFHVHLTDVQVIGRQSLDSFNPDAANWEDFDAQNPTAKTVTLVISGDSRPTAADRCWKDVIRVNPGETVKLAVPYGMIDTVKNTITDQGSVGRYMYHCHILEHEDKDMMRPFLVLPKATRDLMPPHSM